MPQRLCLEPQCPAPATWRGRCDKHKRERNRETRSRNAALYNSKRWQLSRRRKLADTPLCEHEGCEQIATDVHHRTALQAGGDPWNQDNLEALCHAHHSQATRREMMG